MSKHLLAAALMLAVPADAVQRMERFSSDWNDYNLSMDREETIAVFARSKADFAEARIMVSERLDGQWSEPQPISFTDVRYSDSDPWLTPDGRWLYGDTLYFSSVRKDGKGGLDIYAAKRAGDGFEHPMPVGEPFNSAASDSDFTVSSDERVALFWRSVGKAGKLHIARRGPSGWASPQPLPDQINHGPFNFTPSFTADGKSVTYASTALRDGQAEGMADIFIAMLPEVTK